MSVTPERALLSYGCMREVAKHERSVRVARTIAECYLSFCKCKWKVNLTSNTGSACAITRAIGSLEFWNVGFCGENRRGENRTTRRKTSRSRVENQQQTQPTCWRRVRESNPGHIVGRRALSPLRQPCLLPLDIITYCAILDIITILRAHVVCIFKKNWRNTVQAPGASVPSWKLNGLSCRCGVALPPFFYLTTDTCMSCGQVDWSVRLRGTLCQWGLFEALHRTQVE